MGIGEEGRCDVFADVGQHDVRLILLWSLVAKHKEDLEVIVESAELFPPSIYDGDGHGSITFAPLPRVVDRNRPFSSPAQRLKPSDSSPATQAQRLKLIASIRSSTIPIGYTIFKCLRLAKSLEEIHRKS